MGVIAFLSFNLSMGIVWGTFGVLLTAVEARLGVGRQLSSLGVPIITIVVALLAPIMGILAGKMSLRLMMIIASMMGAGGYALLAATHTIQINLLVYGLLIGPCLCVCGLIAPSTLVTRWFGRHRGPALGFVNVLVLMAVAPLLGSLVLQRFGLSAVYLMVSGFMVLNLLIQLFVVDFPPSVIDPSGEDLAAETTADPGLTAGELFRSGRFWAMTLAFGAMTSGSLMLIGHLVAMAAGWGIDATKAASLATAYAVGVMIGGPIAGWVADKLGARIAMAILCFDAALLWIIVLLQPPFPVLVAALFFCGMHSSGGVPITGVGLTEQFGVASFGRGFGLVNMMSLPFTVFTVPLAALVFVKTGSYVGALTGQITLYLLGAAIILSIGRRAGRVGGQGVSSPA